LKLKEKTMPTPDEVAAVLGTNGNDTLVIGATLAAWMDAGERDWTNEVFAFGGDDVVFRDRTGDYLGALDPVYIYGGEGTDTLNYAWLSSGVLADLGFGAVQQMGFAQDRVFGFERFVATHHDDAVYGGAGAEGIWGMGGEDTLSGGSGNDTVRGGLGDDEIDGDSGHDTLYGEDDDDAIDGGLGYDTIYGGDGDDEIDGGHHDDLIYAGDGDDDINAGAGSDTVYLDDGDDTVYGASGNDVIHVAGAGNHDITGGQHSDTVVFGNGATTVDLINGFAIRTDGFDSLAGVENVTTGSGNDVITGSDGANVIKAGSGVDVVLAMGGNDDVRGENGNDNLSGGDGIDTVNGGSGNDTINGGAGNDSITGGDGTDRIRGGAGADVLRGEGAIAPECADFFVWAVGDLGYDVVIDFDLTLDKLSFGAGFFAAGPIGSVLNAADLGGGNAGLVANTSWAGWQPIAVLQGVDAAALDQMITNGTIFDVETVFDGPGGLSFEEPDTGRAPSADSFLF
jgi:Ca2+-binding RTX toxin-like protein